MSGYELLDPPTPPRRPWLAPVVAGLLVVLGGAAVLWDLRDRDHEERQVAACADQAAAVVRRADHRLSSAWGYVRPVLLLREGVPEEVRRDMLVIVSNAGLGADRPLEEVRGRCAAVDLAPWHGTLRERRAACLAALDGRIRFVEAVTADGAAILDWPPRPTGC